VCVGSLRARSGALAGRAGTGACMASLYGCMCVWLVTLTRASRRGGKSNDCRKSKKRVAGSHRRARLSVRTLASRRATGEPARRRTREGRGNEEESWRGQRGLAAWRGLGLGGLDVVRVMSCGGRVCRRVRIVRSDGAEYYLIYYFPCQNPQLASSGLIYFSMYI
jgi:hypothetical protein